MIPVTITYNSINPSISLSVHLTIYLSVCLLINLSVTIKQAQQFVLRSAEANFCCIALRQNVLMQKHRKTILFWLPWIQSYYFAEFVTVVNVIVVHVAWPGNSSLSRLPFGCFSIPTNIPTHSMQLAIHTQLAHHYIQYALWAISVLLFWKWTGPEMLKGQLSRVPLP